MSSEVFDVGRGQMMALSLAGSLRRGREGMSRVVARRRWLQKRQWWVWTGSRFCIVGCSCWRDWSSGCNWGSGVDIFGFFLVVVVLIFLAGACFGLIDVGSF